MALIPWRTDLTIACATIMLVGTFAPAHAKPGPQSLTSISEPVIPYIRDATLVQNAIDNAGRCQSWAIAWVDEAATQEVLTLVQMSLDGAAHQDILDYAAESAHRLDVAGHPWISKAHIWLDDAHLELRRRHGFVPISFGETLGVASLMMDSEYLARANTRLYEIFLLAELLTR